MQYTVPEEIFIFGESFIKLMSGNIIYYDDKSEVYEYYVENVKYANALEFYNVVANLNTQNENPVIIIEESVVNKSNIIKVKKK